RPDRDRLLHHLSSLPREPVRVGLDRARERPARDLDRALRDRAPPDVRGRHLVLARHVAGARLVVGAARVRGDLPHARVAPARRGAIPREEPDGLRRLLRQGPLEADPRDLLSSHPPAFLNERSPGLLVPGLVLLVAGSTIPTSESPTPRTF